MLASFLQLVLLTAAAPLTATDDDGRQHRYLSDLMLLTSAADHRRRARCSCLPLPSAVRRAF